jgi:aspartate/methionine/tyrosine aminotransferase
MSKVAISPGFRLLNVQDPVIPRVQRWVRETDGAISLGQGIVGFGPPPEALEALKRFGHQVSDHRYGPVGGDPDLMEVLSQKLQKDNGFVIGPSQRVLVTAGSNMGFLEALMAITAPGDEVLLPTPYYFNQEMAIRMMGCTPVFVPMNSGFSLDLDALADAITERTRAVVTVSPNNPTGAVYSEAILRAVNRLCFEKGIYHLSDEAYEYFTWGDVPHFSPGSIPGSESFTLSFFSLSKTYGFAAWRIGYMVVPAELEPLLIKIQDTNLICPPRPSQVAAAAALRVGRSYFDREAESLRVLRVSVLTALEALGPWLLEAPVSEGAFYVFLRLATSLKSLDLAERLAREYGVAVVPGEAFGVNTGCSLRVAYGAPEPERVLEGIHRLIRGIRAILEGP